MLGFLWRKLPLSAPNIWNSSCCFESVSLVLIRGLSSSPENISKSADQGKQRFEVFRSSVGPHSVMRFLRNIGFSDSQISKLVTKLPVLLSYDPEETLMPKIEFFNSIGITGPDLVRILSRTPKICLRGITRRFVPCYDFVKSVVLSDDKAVAALKRAPLMLMCDVQTTVAPNVAMLRRYGVSQSAVSYCLTACPTLLMLSSCKFEKHVRELLVIGFDPKKIAFVHAMRVFCGIRKSTRERKMAVFKKFGWSDDEILSALKLHPMCLTLSPKKIMEGLDFLMNKMGWPRKAIARVPLILCYSLDKRLIPRCSVVQVLRSKGFLQEEDCYLSSVLIPPEKVFLERFVSKYEEQVPQLLNFYKQEIGLLELG